MAIKKQCEKCGFFRTEIGLCTQYWQSPVFDDVECNKTPKVNNNIGNNSSLDSLLHQSKPVNEIHTQNYAFQHEQISLAEEFVFTSGFGKMIVGFLVCLAVSVFCGLLGLLFDIGIMTFLGFLSTIIIGLYTAIHYLPMNRHKDDFVKVNNKGVQWKHGKDAGLINWNDILHCEYIFNPSTAIYDGKVYLRVITSIGQEYIIDMTGISHKMTKIVSLINRLSGRELLDLRDTKKQRWKSVAKALLLILLYLLYRLYRQGTFD